MDPNVRYQSIVNKLKSTGHRLTPQRLALIKLLASAESHPSATQLHEQLKRRFPTTSLATVYKTLNVLKDLGEVLEMGFSNGDNRYDGARPYPHPHLICVQCGRIVDADIAPLTELAAEVAAASGYHIVGQRVEFHGVCPACQQRTETP